MINETSSEIAQLLAGDCLAGNKKRLPFWDSLCYFFIFLRRYLFQKF
jgi:hypothetical protein